MKSKKESVKEIIDDNLDIFGMVETHLDRSDMMEIDGYHVIRKDRNKEGGGVLIGIKMKYKETTLELETQSKENLESLWITIGTKTRHKN